MTVRRTVKIHPERQLSSSEREVLWCTFEELLLQFGLSDLDLNSSVNLLLVTTLVVGIVLDGRREQGVDKRGLSQARLSSNLEDYQY